MGSRSDQPESRPLTREQMRKNAVGFRNAFGPARSIWPTGEPARPMPEWEVRDCVVAVNLRLALGWSAAAVEAALPRTFAVWQHHRRTRGIAEGLWLVRRRARWLAWLAGSAEAHIVGTYERAQLAGSPEGFLLPWCAWLDLDLLATLLELPPHLPRGRKAAALSILASPEWAALPWQREAGR